MKAFLFGGESMKSDAANFGLLVMRLIAGLGLAFGHGINKDAAPEKFIEGVAKIGFPYPDGLRGRRPSANSWAALPRFGLRDESLGILHRLHDGNGGVQEHRRWF
ncbi:MAG: hypothetical protein IPP40_14190 [bacterium]|nr:hypothetical protein [bacterium]